MGNQKHGVGWTGRRRFLRGVTASVVAVGLAGCSGSTPDAGGGNEDGTGNPEGSSDGGGDGEGPEAAARALLTGYREDDLSTVQAYLHPDAPARDRLTEQQVADVDPPEVTAVEVAAMGDGRAVLNLRSAQSGEGQADWNTAELRQVDGEWLVYEIRTGRATPAPDQMGSIEGDGTPEATVRAFLSALDGSDVEAFRTTLHPQSRLGETFTSDEIEATSAELLAVERLRVEDGVAVVNARVELSGSTAVQDGRYWLAFRLQEYGGAWRVTSLTGGRQTPSPTATATPSPTPVPTATPTATGGEPTATERTGSTAFFEGFEDGTDRWEVFVKDGWRALGGLSHSGDYSAAASRGTYTRRIAAADVTPSAPASEFSYYWLEVGGSYGGGVRLLNDAGGVELGFATDNPEWVVDDASGVDIVGSGEGYERWVETAAAFDWAAGTAVVTFRDLESGETYEGTHSLKAGENVSRIQLCGFTSDSGWETSSCRMAWDDISLRV